MGPKSKVSRLRFRKKYILSMYQPFVKNTSYNDIMLTIQKL